MPKKTWDKVLVNDKLSLDSAGRKSCSEWKTFKTSSYLSRGKPGFKMDQMVM